MTIDDITALPDADAEQAHLVDEITHPQFVDQVQHGFADECGAGCACQPEAGR